MDWLFYEREAQEAGYHAVCGVDEAGRGPLAGPVFAAAVILPAGFCPEGINDSKKLSEKRREALFKTITEEAVAYGIASASEKEIDEINILNATFLAMNRAVAQLSTPADFILVDGNRTPEFSAPARPLIKGDALSASIAAASILAKVSRDSFMLEQAQKYPQYGFEKHKGYPTALHREMVRLHGPCEIHRLSFLKKIIGKHA